VKAIVRLREGETVDAAALQVWVAEALAHFKVPSIVAFSTDPLPRNATGKLLKAQLRAESVANA
jgi:acyl-CoA synthetase (AMP-forming)/AMP-acid ligase II